MDTKLSSPRPDKPSEAAHKVGSVVTTIIRSDDDLPDPSGTPRRQKLSLRQSESIVTQELSSSSDSVSESEKEEVASTASNNCSLWQETVDPTQLAQNSEGHMDSTAAITQVCGGNALVEAKTLDTTHGIATTTRL